MKFDVYETENGEQFFMPSYLRGSIRQWVILGHRRPPLYSLRIKLKVA